MEQASGSTGSTGSTDTTGAVIEPEPTIHIHAKKNQVIQIEPMTVISFDIGVKNLAVCVLTLSATETKVHVWRVISVVDPGAAVPALEDLYPRLFQALDSLVLECQVVHKLSVIDFALVENQPVHKNPTMKSVQMMIYSYFALRGFRNDVCRNVANCSATSKLKGHSITIPPLPDKVEGYQRLKQMAVQYCNAYCQDDPHLMKTLSSYSKQDDICDSLLQAMSWVNRYFPNKYAVRKLKSAIPLEHL